MLDALPLQENILTNQLIVNTTSQQLQPMTIQYVDDFDDTKTQDVCTLNLNGARVLSNYINATPITTNGTHEFDVVDSNVNMPIMNYQVDVNLPIYDAPAVYTTKRINSNGDYVLGDFVNDNINDYTYLHKDIPVIIDLDTTMYLFYLKYNNVEFNKSNMLYQSQTGDVTLTAGKTIISYQEITGTNDFASIGIIENNTGSAQNVNIVATAYYKIIDYGVAYPNSFVLFENSMREVIFSLNDQGEIDNKGAYIRIYKTFIDYSYF